MAVVRLSYVTALFSEHGGVYVTHFFVLHPFTIINATHSVEGILHLFSTSGRHGEVFEEDHAHSAVCNLKVAS